MHDRQLGHTGHMHLHPMTGGISAGPLETLHHGHQSSRILIHSGTRSLTPSRGAYLQICRITRKGPQLELSLGGVARDLVREIPLQVKNDVADYDRGDGNGHQFFTGAAFILQGLA